MSAGSSVRQGEAPEEPISFYQEVIDRDAERLEAASKELELAVESYEEGHISSGELEESAVEAFETYDEFWKDLKRLQSRMDSTYDTIDNLHKMMTHEHEHSKVDAEGYLEFGGSVMNNPMDQPENSSDYTVLDEIKSYNDHKDFGLDTDMWENTREEYAKAHHLAAEKDIDLE